MGAMNKARWRERKNRVYRKVLADYQGQDIKVNYTSYYWIDNQHVALQFRELIDTVGSFREALKRIKATPTICVNV